MLPVREFLPMFSVLWCHGVRSFMVSCLTFMSLSPFETGFVLVLGWVLTSFVGMQLSSFVNDTFAISEKPREGPPLWAGKSPKNSQKHSMTVRFKCLPRVCFVTGFFFFFCHAMRQAGSQFPDQGSNLHPLY